MLPNTEMIQIILHRIKQHTSSVYSHEYNIISYEINILEDIKYTLDKLQSYMPTILYVDICRILETIKNINKLKLYTIGSKLPLSNNHGMLYVLQNDLIEVINNNYDKIYSSTDTYGGYFDYYDNNIQKLFINIFDHIDKQYDNKYICSYVTYYIHDMYGYAIGFLNMCMDGETIKTILKHINDVE